MNVTLRTVQEADRLFLLSVYASTRAAELELVDWSEELKTAFIQQQFDAQDHDYRSHFCDPTFDVVLVDGEPAGRLYVDRRPEQISVADISLVPEFRGRGVGTSLLAALQSEAAASGRQLSLHVERFNPAQRLYLRLGFEPVEEGPVYLLMRWSPATHLASTR
jgi:ribosomal protein S18 acetylase RimI-like enzyme